MKQIIKFGAVLSLAAALAACSSVQNGNQSDNGNNTNKHGELTVVKKTEQKPNQDVMVQRIHRFEGASMDKWLSDDQVQLMYTKLVKQATATEEAKFEYTTMDVDLSNNEQTSAAQPVKKVQTVEKEQPSPDGKYVFNQQWKDKYTARNFIKEVSTGNRTEIKGSNYLETGGWLNDTTYVLAAGSMSGLGDIRQITADGTVTLLKLDDPSLGDEPFVNFGVGQGRIYYTDHNQTLKQFAPGEPKPTELVKHAMTFQVSPDGKHLAVEIQKEAGKTGSELRIFDSNGSAEGLSIAKGDLIPYIAWSPDSSKLAAALYTENQSGMNGVYIFDSATGKVSPIGPSYFPQYPLSWNPSGTRLGVTVADKDSMPVTHIIDFQ
ncbi:TolB family protein [Paenibacillus sp. MMO-177]|uniref:TolB family protein n=1 Tax=Paenibacillus sp. MMO-177 TaxID=3081289 RepID=UPI003016C6A5